MLSALHLTRRAMPPPRVQFKEMLRKDIIELILATDMKQVSGRTSQEAGEGEMWGGGAGGRCFQRHSDPPLLIS